MFEKTEFGQTQIKTYVYNLVNPFLNSLPPPFPLLLLVVVVVAREIYGKSVYL